ncbi:MAG: hypothetical protein N4J56_007090 [Chroococcidiopsis sp. SAG 2025]|nr:hypothetical protein [Chroococcidiopsis sp. SAG 2025]
MRSLLWQGGKKKEVPRGLFRIKWTGLHHLRDQTYIYLVRTTRPVHFILNRMLNNAKSAMYLLVNFIFVTANFNQ